VSRGKKFCLRERFFHLQKSRPEPGQESTDLIILKVKGENDFYDCSQRETRSMLRRPARSQWNDPFLFSFGKGKQKRGLLAIPIPRGECGASSGVRTSSPNG